MGTPVLDEPYRRKQSLDSFHSKFNMVADLRASWPFLRILKPNLQRLWTSLGRSERFSTTSIRHGIPRTASVPADPLERSKQPARLLL